MLSIVIPWYNRGEISQALPSLVGSIEEIGGDITVVNLNGESAYLYSLLGDFKKNLRIVTASNSEKFNKPWAQNLGAKYTSQPYLFFCDCDIILPPGELKKLFDRVYTTENSFGTLAGVRETELNARQANNLAVFGYELRLKIKDGTEVKIIDHEEDANTGTRQAPGLLLVKRADFAKINGYNGYLDGWGWEDQDMICRLTLEAKLTRITLGQALHISHDDNSRMQSYSNYEDRWQSRDRMFRRALANYDKNNFMGTYLRDVQIHSVTIE